VVAARVNLRGWAPLRYIRPKRECQMAVDARVGAPGKRLEVDPESLVSVVVIGLNEAMHLPACFASLSSSRSRPREVLYVDSGSTDASAVIAEQVGARVMTLGGVHVSAAAARNVGLAHAQGTMVHFIDGDMTLGRNWLEAGATALSGDPTLACVFGPVIEVWTSLADRIIGRDWSNRRPGYVEAPGSGGTFRVEVLRRVGGYPEDLVAGEEIELGRRLRTCGYGVRCLSVSMGTHELGVSDVRTYWRRWARGGLARWQLIRLRPLSRSEWLQLVKPFVFAGGAVTTALLTIGPRRRRFLGLVGALAYVGLVTRLALRESCRGEDFPMALASSLENYVRCIPITFGFIDAGTRAFFRTSLRTTCRGVAERRGC